MRATMSAASTPDFEVHRIGPSRLRLLVTRTAALAAEFAAREVVCKARDGERFRLGLATGATFEPVYAALVNAAKAGLFRPGRTDFRHLDEYFGVESSAPGSMARELNESFLRHLPEAPRSFVPVPGGRAEAEGAVKEHLADLGALGPVDLQLVGIGRNAHIAFNEPGTPFHLRSAVLALSPETRSANAPRFPGGEVPAQALTTGPRTLLETGSLCLVATGSSKSRALKAALEGDLGPLCPASLVRLHRNAIVIADQDAASELALDRTASMQSQKAQVLGPSDLNPPGGVLVISPHPDDASISCGGLLGSLPASLPKLIVTMTTGARARVSGGLSHSEVTHLREDEVRREAVHLRAETVFLRCRFYDSGVFEESDVLSLIDVFLKFRPAWVLAPSLDDPHPTHRLARQITDEALARHLRRERSSLEVWTFEGPWFQHPKDQANVLFSVPETVFATKLLAVREHRSQMERVPFDIGASALADLRAVLFSESHLGGTEPGRLASLPKLECYVREVVQTP